MYIGIITLHNKYCASFISMKNGMTVASEISRLQNAKADIKTAIEEKGVEVGNDVKLDEYAACIWEIQQWATEWILPIAAPALVPLFQLPPAWSELPELTLKLSQFLLPHQNICKYFFILLSYTGIGETIASPFA